MTAPRLDWAPADWFNKRLAAWINFRWLGRRRRFRHGDVVLDILVQELQRQRGPHRPLDHIIFSGDATALGFESEFRRAAVGLKVADGALPPGLAVPGNHDYCTVAAAASGLFERYFAPWQVGRRVDDAIYPFAQRVGHLWLIAVNSCTGNRLAWDAGGSVGTDQLARLERLLESLEPGLRILVTHYPVCLASGKRARRVHGLRNLPEVIAVAARGGIKLWLHGHRHDPYCLADTSLAPFPVVCAGSATQTGCWSFSEYAIEGAEVQVLQRVFNPLERCFEDGREFRLTL